MILTIGVAAGLIAGLARAWLGKHSYQVPRVRYPWLILLAFLPQFVAFGLSTRLTFPDRWVPVVLLSSQVVLLLWIFFNRKRPDFWLLGIGLGLNFLVIALNGGMMPIRPAMVQHLLPQAPEGSWQIGSRFGTGKDVVLLVEQTRLWFLSDWFTLPDWLHYRVAFSIGDVFITIGVFWLLWSSGGSDVINLEVKDEQEILRPQRNGNNLKI